MSYYPLSVRNLVKNFSKLPGIGEKTAERLAMHVIRMPRRDAERLSSSIREVKEKIKLCSVCFALSDDDVCHICRDVARNATLLCVVEQPADMIAIEKSGSFKGLYHILQGVMSPMDGVGPDDIRLKELISRVKTGGVEEVVIATGTMVEGESTASYIAECLEPYAVKVTRIASGVPMGGDLKYVDQLTLRKAMESRNAV
ncbi:recombination mediator RecR [Thermodesulfobacteriota bacterium]